MVKGKKATPIATTDPFDQQSFMVQVALEAMNELGSLFFVKDHERRFVVCTTALVHHLGFRDPRQVIGLRDEDLSPVHLVEHYRQYDENILKSGRRIVELVELVRNVDGSYDWFTTTKWALRNDQQQIVGIAGVIKDLKSRHTTKNDLLPLTPAIEMMAAEYHQKLTVEMLADAAAMSQSYFNRQFKRYFGTTPHRYLRSIRLMAVCELLSTTDLSLTAIAHQTGYYDQSHLSHEFVRDRALSPAAYRRNHRVDPPPPPATQLSRLHAFSSSREVS